MSLILIVLSLAKYCSSSAALVTSPSPDNFAPISTSAESRPLRTVWDIVRNCLATLLAAAWISAHPNAPWLEEKSWAFLTRRISLMCLTVIRPEAMILSALQQWQGAVMLRDVVNTVRPTSGIILFVLDFGITQVDTIFCRSTVDDGTCAFLAHGWLHSELYEGRTPSLFGRL